MNRLNFRECKMPATTTTQSEILKFLRENSGNFVSGSNLADRLGISRTGIWKHIRKLKETGYEILSHPKEGYKLIEVPDSLSRGEIVPNLETGWLGLAYHYLDTTTSTNDHALLLAAQGAPNGTVVVAEEQTKGRGRLRRDWLSMPNRGIYMSILLRNPLPVRVAPQSTYLAAVALVKVLRSKFSLPASIKWPNDVLIGSRKVAGILTEMQSDQDYSRFVVIGIGINVNYSRDELGQSFRYPATSIAMEVGRTVKRQHVLLAFLNQLDEGLRGFSRKRPCGGNSSVRGLFRNPGQIDYRAVWGPRNFRESRRLYSRRSFAAPPERRGNGDCLGWRRSTRRMDNRTPISCLRLRTSGAFHRFLLPLAFNTQGRDRPGIQAFDSNIVAAFFALAEIAVLDTLERLAYLQDQLTFPVPYAQHEVPVRFQCCTIRRIREVFFIIRHSGNCSFGFRIELVQSFQKDFLEIRLSFLIHFETPLADFERYWLT